MTGEVVLVCSPVSHLVGEISPDDAILIEWQLEDGNVVVEMPDGLVGDDHAEDEEQQQGETCDARQNPVLHEDGVCQGGYRGDETEMRQQMVEEHQGAHRLGCTAQTSCGMPGR